MFNGFYARSMASPRFIDAVLLAMTIAYGATGTIHAQCTINSSNGYTVVAHVVPVDIVPSSSSCPWGYNYNVRLAYEIEFNGAGAPASMWTLQGNVICGGQSLFFNLPNSGGSGVVTTTSNAWRGVSDCTTADVSSLSCFSVRLQVNGPGISNQTVDCGFSPLPVELVSFAAEAIDSEVHLRWTTASETNSDRSVVERSKDGSNFDQIAVVPATGNSSTLLHYAAIDSDPLPGTTYYRLRLTDLRWASGIGALGGGIPSRRKDRCQGLSESQRWPHDRPAERRSRQWTGPLRCSASPCARDRAMVELLDPAGTPARHLHRRGASPNGTAIHIPLRAAVDPKTNSWLPDKAITLKAHDRRCDHRPW